MVVISFILVVLYVGATIWRKKDLPASISSLVYDLPTGWQWVWTAWIWSVGLLTCIPVIEALSAKGLEFLGFLTLCCITFCGAMPVVRNQRNTAHNVFGVSAGILSQICVCFISPLWLLVWLGFIAIPFIVEYRAVKSFPLVMYDNGVFILESFSTLCYIFCLLAVFI